jgi:hypothetical protein
VAGLLLAALALASCLGLAPWAGAATTAASSCDTSWKSAASGFWDVAGNWTAGVPDNTKNACITLAGTYTVTVRGGRNANGITLGGASGQQTLQLVGDTANGGASLTLQNQGSASDGVLAHGRLVLTSTDANSSAWLNGSGTLTNNGTISVDAGAGGQRFWWGDVTNTASGTITINQLTDSNGGVWTNSNALTIANGTGLTGIGAFTNAGTLTNGGTFSQNGDFTWTSGAIANNGSFTANSGIFTTGPGSASGNPLVLVNKTVSPNGGGSAVLIVQGTNTLASDIASGYPLTLQGNTTFGTAVLSYSANRTNNTTIHLTSTDANSSAWLNGSGTLTNNGTISVDAGAGGQRFWWGDVNNTAHHTITINQTTQGNGSAWTSKGNLSVAAGQTLDLGAASLTLTGGTLSGKGTIQANVTNTAASVAPGASPGTLTISGTYTQQKKGKLTIEINGANAGQFDVLAISGAASLNGTLVLKPANSFKGTLGQTFPVLTAGSVSGTFSKVSKAVINSNTGLYYGPTYPGGGVTLVVKQGTLTVPASGARGASVNVSGTGWLAGEKIALTFTDSTNHKTNYPAVTTDGSGNFSTSITIPAGASPGNGKISAKSAITALTITKTINIT